MKKAIDQVISDVMSKNRESDTVRLASNGRLVVPRVSTQCRSLDRAVGGGMPLGRIVEIYGDAGCGKTTLGLHLLSEIQNQGGHAYFIDMETALDLEYAGEILDLDDLVMIEPSTGEDMFGIMWDIIRSKKEHDPDTPGVMIIDSLAGIVTQREIDAIAKGGFEKSENIYSPQARLMSSALRSVTEGIKQANLLVVFTNQVRVKMNTFGFGRDNFETPGGKALKFYSSVRLELTRIGYITGKDKEKQGNILRARAVKNKTAVPMQIADFRLMWGEGIDRRYDLFQRACELGVLKASGSWIKYGEEERWQGEHNFLDALRDQQLFDIIEMEINENEE